MSVGLILEGGGTRGVYTAGVLDALIDNKIFMEFRLVLVIHLVIFLSSVAEIIKYLMNIFVTRGILALIHT